MKKLFKLSAFTLFGVFLLLSCGGNENKVDLPVDLRATLDDIDQGVLLEWTSSSESFDIEVTNQTTGRIIGKATTTNSLKLSNLDPGKYVWKVKAMQGGKASDWGDGPSFEITDVIENMNKPTLAGVEMITSHSALLKFNPTDVNYNYQIEIVGVDGAIVEMKIPSYATPKTGYIYTPVKLEPGTQYIWRVRVKEGKNVSGWVTDSINLKTKPKPSANNQYVIVSAEINGKKQVWGVDMRVNQEAEPVKTWSFTNMFYDETFVGEDTLRGSMIGIVSKLVHREGDFKAGTPYPFKQVLFKFPAKVGTYSNYQFHTYPWIDYVDSTAYDFHKSNNGYESIRHGDFAAFTADGGKAEITKATTGSTVIDGLNVPTSTVTGVYTSNLFDAWDVLSAGSVNGLLPVGNVKVEFFNITLPAKK